MPDDPFQLGQVGNLTELLADIISTTRIRILAQERYEQERQAEQTRRWEGFCDWVHGLFEEARIQDLIYPCRSATGIDIYLRPKATNFLPLYGAPLSVFCGLPELQKNFVVVVMTGLVWAWRGPVCRDQDRVRLVDGLTAIAHRLAGDQYIRLWSEEKERQARADAYFQALTCKLRLTGYTLHGKPCELQLSVEATQLKVQVDGTDIHAIEMIDRPGTQAAPTPRLLSMLGVDLAKRGIG